jgi:Mn-dependent DtxR family transcriptional regulator
MTELKINSAPEMRESGEMYLETILILSENHPVVRSIDVAGEMGFSRPSVSRAVSTLKNRGYITVEKNGGLILTDAGREIATKIYERHRVISRLLKKIGVPDKVADADACRIEHVISDETFDAIKNSISQ